MKSIERSLFRFMTALLSLALLGACASGSRIVANSDPSANFAQFRTFGFMQPLGTDNASGRTLTSQHLIAAVSDELQMRGLRRSDDSPDLLVNFFISTREVVTSSPSSNASVHWRRGRYSSWGGYSMSMGTPTVTQQTQGTVAVDLVDASRDQLVWEGAATKRVTDSRRRNLEETLSNAITDLFVELPF
jgi:hypothetical protein